MTTKNGFVHANGIEIYYQESGEGEPLVLLHGGMGHSDHWLGYMETLAKHFRVIAPDTRGHGKTKNPTGELRYSLLADDVAALISALGLEQPLVCGYSDGGHTTVELGMRYSHQVKALVVAGVFLRITDSYIDTLKTWGVEGAGVVNLAYIEEKMPEMKEFLQQAHASQGEGYWKEILRALSVMWLTPIQYTPADFQKITVPTLMLVGDRDELAPVAQSVEMYGMLPQGELAVLANATHESTISRNGEDNPQFLEVVLEFLLRHKAS